MKLSAILADRRTLEIPFGEDVLIVVYAPSLVTPRNISVALDQEDDNQSQAVVELLVTLIEEWDLTGDDGQPVAISAETLEILPVRFLSDVLVAITGDTNTDPTNSGNSGATSSRKARLARSRNGIR
jgi:hypothetical protein